MPLIPLLFLLKLMAFVSGTFYWRDLWYYLPQVANGLRFYEAFCYAG